MQFKGGKPPEVNHFPQLIDMLIAMKVKIDINTPTPKTIEPAAKFDEAYLNEYYKIWFEEGPKAFSESKYSHAAGAHGMENALPQVMSMMMNMLGPEAKAKMQASMGAMGL